MHTLDVVPGERIGPFALGMTKTEIDDAAAAADLALEWTTVRAALGGSTALVGGQVFVYLNAEGTADEIEAALSGPGHVTWNGKALDGAATDIVASFDAMGVPDRTHPEYPATTSYPTLGISLWMDAKPRKPLQGEFESVLIRRPDHVTLRDAD